MKTQGRGPGSPHFGQAGFQLAFLVAIKTALIVAMKISFMFCSSDSRRYFELQSKRTMQLGSARKIKPKNNEASLEMRAHH